MNRRDLIKSLGISALPITASKKLNSINVSGHVESGTPWKEIPEWNKNNSDVSYDEIVTAFSTPNPVQPGEEVSIYYIFDSTENFDLFWFPHRHERWIAKQSKPNFFHHYNYPQKIGPWAEINFACIETEYVSCSVDQLGYYWNDGVEKGDYALEWRMEVPKDIEEKTYSIGGGLYYDAKPIKGLLDYITVKEIDFETVMDFIEAYNTNTDLYNQPVTFERVLWAINKYNA